MSCSVSERLPESRGGAGGGGGGGGGCRLKGSSNTSLATPPNSKGGQQGAPSTGGGGGGNGPMRQRPCRLCWCCCCSCCSTPGKGSDENGPTKNNSEPNVDGDPPPSLEEIRSWGRSFDKLMRSTAGRKVFREFLKCEYSEENILFWLACEELKRETSPEAIEEKARIIYEDYISILSPREVSLDSRVREVVNRNMVGPTPVTFDEAQVQIYTLMHRDSYPRFVNSPMFKSLAQLNGGDTASDSAPMLLDNDGPHG